MDINDNNYDAKKYIDILREDIEILENKVEKVSLINTCIIASVIGYMSGYIIHGIYNLIFIK